MTLPSLLAAVVSALDGAGIAHMVAGSVASMHHGEPRTTQDIDLVIDATAGQLVEFVARFDRDRYYVGDALGALTRKDQFNIIDTITGWKVDLIFVRDRPFSREEFARRRPVDILGVRTAVATAEDTLLAKLEWARLGESERQRRDVAAVVAVQRGELDLGYLRRWAAELGLTDDLEAVLTP
jgi:hypothetical protein